MTNGSPEAKWAILHPDWLAWATATLSAKQVDELDYQEGKIRKRLLQSISLAYWNGLVAHAQTRRIDVDEIGRQLGYGRSVYNKWIAGTEVPNPMSFFGAVVIVLREELNRIPLPQLREIAWSATARTLSLIRTEELGGAPSPAIEREHFRCVKWFTCHPRSFTPDTKNKLSDLEADRTHDAVLERNLASGQGRSVKTLNQLADAIKLWAKPYALFRVGLRLGWEIFDDS